MSTNREKRIDASLNELFMLYQICHNNFEDELTLNLIQTAISNIESLKREED